MAEHVVDDPDGGGTGFATSVATGGWGDTAIGAPSDGSTGAVHVGTWGYSDFEGAIWDSFTPEVRSAKLQPDVLASGDRFGQQVAWSSFSLLVSAPGSDLYGTDCGAIYQFYSEEGPVYGWVRESEPLVPAICDGGPYGGLGNVMDSGSNFVVALSGSTRAYVHVYNVSYSGNPLDTVVEPPFPAWSWGNKVVDMSVAVDDQGTSPRFAISDPWTPKTVVYERVWCAEWTCPWLEVASFDVGGPLAFSDGRLVVGTDGNRGDWLISGPVRVFEETASGWAVTVISPPDGTVGFGWPVALAGDMLFVGDMWVSDRAGVVYSFDLSEPTQSRRRLRTSQPASEALFGSDIDTLTTGACGDGVDECADATMVVVAAPSGWGDPVPRVHFFMPFRRDAFHDDDSSVFEADIEWLAAEGITTGCNPPVNDKYCPDGDVTRGQMAAFLVRALGLTDRLDDPFIDDDDSIFEADIEKLAAAGITRGCNPPANDRFCPDSKVTRAQMAAFLVRALGYTDNGGGDLFVDDDDSIFETDIDRLGTAGVTKGCNPPANDRYCPTGNVTRGQMAAFLHRALG